MLKVQNLSKVYDNGPYALREVSFEVKPHEFVVILGRSGSGKSTLLRCLNRLIEPTEGQIFFNDQEITGADRKNLRNARRKIGIIFQQYNLVKRSTTLTNVLMGRLGYMSTWAGLLSIFSTEDYQTALGNLNRLGISDQTFQRADTLSGGQQQRVAIARALMQNPELILADEPVSSLDPGLARTILAIFKEINQKDGVTIVCNLHQPSLARQYGHRIIALKEGQCVFDGPPGSLNDLESEKIYGSID